MKVLRTGGELIVWRRPDKNAYVSVKDYIPCKFCLAFITKSEMWRHIKFCPLKNDDSFSKNNNCIQQSECLLYPNKTSGDAASTELQHLVLSSMINDQISACVKKDTLILTYGSFMLTSSGIKKINGISQRMRILARLLIKLREKRNEPDASLVDLVKPPNFDDFIACTQELGGFSLRNEDGENISYFATPSLPLKIGYSLEKCCSLLKGIGIKQKDPIMQLDAVQFQDLFNLEWVAKISTVCLKTMDENKFNKVTLLPLTEDLLKVRSHLKVKIPEVTAKLNSDPCLEDWRYLAELVGTRLTIFNRRRGNEVYQLLVSKFTSRNQTKEAEIEEIKNSLTSIEKRLMQR